MAKASDNPILTEAILDFSGGVDSLKATTVQSMANPNGLARNELAWLINGTVRDGGITPRWGWQPLFQVTETASRVLAGTALYQGGWTYEPKNGNPYAIYLIGGEVFKCPLDGSGPPVSLSAAFNLWHPKTVTLAFFCQAEEFLVIQAGDFTTLPLFWDGTTLRRSIGITNTAVAPGTPGVNEIPAAGPMDYYMGRLWYAQDRTYSAGDIVGGNSGTIAYRFRNAVLNVTENPLVVGGDGFTVPSNAGNIKALRHGANLNTALGEGQLFIFTRKAVYALTVPVTRADWIAATGTNQPIQTVVQLVNGAVGDRSVVPVNGDLFYQSFEPGIRSLVNAVRYFQQWGNTSISANVQRLLQFNDRALLRYSSGIAWDNRLLQTALPKQTAYGVVHQALAPMDFIPLSQFGANLNPVWEGAYEGLDILQLFTGDFGGLQRAFALVVSRKDQSIWTWELTEGNTRENGDDRVTMVIEFPAMTWGTEFNFKRLLGAELWIDRLYGTVEFYLDYRVDGENCWIPWHAWKECSARTSAEDPIPISYPAQNVKTYGEGYRNTMGMPKPPSQCSPQMNRPSDIGAQFQPRLTVKGFCRVRGVYLFAEPFDRKMYSNIAGQ